PAPAPAAATSSPAPTSTPPSLTSAREELMAATDPLACFGFDGLSERVGKLLYRWQAASRNGTEELIADARDDILKLDLTRVRLPDSAEGRRLRAALLAFAAAETASATTEEPTPTPVPAPAGAGARGGSGGG
ncbi:hypothetical protein KUG12_08080, partial [Streptomyces sp. BV333]|nr:hypothetical protein [Streptomyces sp. BV333]